MGQSNVLSRGFCLFDSGAEDKCVHLSNDNAKILMPSARASARFLNQINKIHETEL